MSGHGPDLESTPASPLKSEVAATPRSFARGAGFVLQAVGASLFFLTTCACCGFAFVEGGGVWAGLAGNGEVNAPNETARDPGAYTLLLLTSALGSLALVGFGVGQQADRGRFPAIGNAVTTAVMVALYVFSLMRLISSEVPIVWCLIAGGMALVSCVLCGLSFPALVQTLRHPASSDPPTVTADAFPDPWAEERPRDPSPARQDLLRRREQIDRELREMEEKKSGDNAPD